MAQKKPGRAMRGAIVRSLHVLCEKAERTERGLSMYKGADDEMRRMYEAVAKAKSELDGRAPHRRGERSENVAPRPKKRPSSGRCRKANPAAVGAGR